MEIAEVGILAENDKMGATQKHNRTHLDDVEQDAALQEIFDLIDGKKNDQAVDRPIGNGIDNNDIPEDLSGTASKLLESIKSVTIRSSRLRSAASTWEIEIYGKTLCLDGRKVDGFGHFRSEYLNKFHRSIRLSGKEWDAVFDIIANRAQVVEEPEASDSEIIANLVFDALCKLTRTPGPGMIDEALHPTGDDFYVTAKTVFDTVDRLGFKIGPKALSSAFVDLGYRIPSDDRPYINGKQVRVYKLAGDTVRQSQKV